MGDGSFKLVTWIEEEEILFTWVIKKFASFEPVLIIQSEKIVSKNGEWRLQLRKIANTLDTDVSYSFVLINEKRSNGTGFSYLPRVEIKIHGSKKNREVKLANLPHHNNSLFGSTTATLYKNQNNVSKSDLEGTENGFLDDGDLKISVRMIFPGQVKHALQDPEPLVGIENQTAKMKEMLTSGADADIAIATATKLFPAHKNIVKNSSPVFQKMLENDLNVIKIEDFSEEAVGAMLSWIYTGTADNFSENAVELLKLSEKYAIDGLKKDAETTMIKNLTKENAAEYYQAALKFNSTRLNSIVLQFMLRNKMEALPVLTLANNNAM